MTDGRAVRVGVTGHRFLAEVERLRAAVAAALDRLESAFPGAEPVCVSPLAEGADRLVARAMLARGARLIAVLPLPADDCLSDFASEHSRADFLDLLARAAETVELPPTSSRTEAYARAGRYVLDHSDALIAIWDGKPAHGAGGTGEIAQCALDRGMPLLHIRAGNREPGTTRPTSLGDEQGTLLVHNLPPP